MEYGKPAVLPQAGDGPGMPLSTTPTVLGTTALRGPRPRSRRAPPARPLLRPAHTTGPARRAGPGAADPRLGVPGDPRERGTGHPRGSAGLPGPQGDRVPPGPGGPDRCLGGAAGPRRPALGGDAGLRRPVRERARSGAGAAALGPGRHRPGRPVADRGAGAARGRGDRGRDGPRRPPRTPLRRAARRHRLAPGLLRGNAGSALAGAARQLDVWAHAHGRADVAARARALTAELFTHPFLADTGTLLAGTRTSAGTAFRRRSCCLYYRVPGGGVCGDCCFTRPPRSSPRAPSG